MNNQNMPKMGLFRAFTLMLAALLIFPLGACGAKSNTALRTVYAMSTAITFQVVGREAEAACDEMEAALADFEQAASAFIETSEVAQVNRLAGQGPVEVSERIYYVIKRGIDAAGESEGMFDVTIGALTALWDIMSDHPRVPRPDEITAAMALINYRDIVLRAEDGRYTVELKRAGQRLDLGGIAKGYALDIFREIMERRQIERGLISIGGNVMVYKDKDGQPYTVGIRYPVADSDGGWFCALQMTDTIISTTGGYERFFVQDGVTYHHVIDPRTGYPAQNKLLSVSVIYADGLTADYLSTMLFVGGLDYTLAWMEAGGQAVAVDNNHNVYISESLRASVVQDQCDPDYVFYYV